MAAARPVSFSFGGSSSEGESVAAEPVAPKEPVAAGVRPRRAAPKRAELSPAAGQAAAAVGQSAASQTAAAVVQSAAVGLSAVQVEQTDSAAAGIKPRRAAKRKPDLAAPVEQVAPVKQVAPVEQVAPVKQVAPPEPARIQSTVPAARPVEGVLAELARVVHSIEWIARLAPAPAREFCDDDARAPSWLRPDRIQPRAPLAAVPFE